MHVNEALERGKNVPESMPPGRAEWHKKRETRKLPRMAFP